MKTYQDLSDEQLIELFCIAVNAEVWNYPDAKVIRDQRILDDPNGIVVSEGGSILFSTQIRLMPSTGDIWQPSNGDNYEIVWNIWQIIAKCKAWGVDYSPAQP